jgi:hypothetical protein
MVSTSAGGSDCKLSVALKYSEDVRSERSVAALSAAEISDFEEDYREFLEGNMKLTIDNVQVIPRIHGYEVLVYMREAWTNTHRLDRSMASAAERRMELDYDVESEMKKWVVAADDPDPDELAERLSLA